MTEPLTVAYSELTRVLPWSLRALGYRFGVADRASHLVATAASMAPGVLEDIAVVAQRPVGTPKRVWQAGTLSIDAGGVSWLEVGPAVMDYLGAHAAGETAMSCRISGATEPSLIPAVLLTGAECGLSSIAVRTTNEGMRWDVLDIEGAGGWPILISGQGMEALGTVLGKVGGVRDVLPSGFPDLLGVTLLSRAERFGLQPGAAAKKVVQPEEELARAFARGIPIAPEVLKTLYDLEKITWAPTSERSRAQAGFQQQSAGQAT